ncbi:MAG: septum formation initiator family protein [Verrucomicrobiales bacterium]|nr:septum formation initiator family protein [Verrucomicrobiales bacterium]
MRDTEFYDPDREPFVEEEEQAQGPDIWQRGSKVIMALLFLCVVAAALRLFIPEIERRNQLEEQALQFEKDRAEKTARVAELRKEYDLLKNDREYLEMVARDRLDLAKEGETIIRLDRSLNESGVPAAK